jgi:hypothetical protein
MSLTKPNDTVPALIQACQPVVHLHLHGLYTRQAPQHRPSGLACSSRLRPRVTGWRCWTPGRGGAITFDLGKDAVSRLKKPVEVLA